MNRATAIIRDENASGEEMVIVDKYEQFMDYLYPRLSKCNRRHAAIRDVIIAAMARPVASFHAAGKSSQITRLFIADGELAEMRTWLRFLAHPDRGVLKPEQHREALKRLAEVGKILGTWIKTAKGNRSPSATSDIKESNASPRSRG